MAQVFISYSRAQFYFVESLVLSLQSYGVTMWFDVQRIYPGSEWEASIEQGLATSTELILVLSRTALASPHVRKEWEHAIKADIPIYVVLWENIPLPAELKNVAILDMRNKFEQQSALLAKLLLTKQRQHAIKKAKRIPFLRSSSLFITIVAMWASTFLYLSGLTLISTIIILKIASIHAHPLPVLFSLLTIVTNWAFFVGYALMYPWQFTRRGRFNIRMYTFSICALPVDTAALLAFDLEFFHRVLPHDLAEALREQYLPSENFIPLLLIGCAVALGIVAMRLLLARRSALHWLRTGSAPDELRIRMNKKWLLPWQLTPVPATNKTYRLYYHPEDRDIAEEIVSALEKNPYLQRGTDQQVDYHIAILTSKVTVASFNRLSSIDQHLVCVIGTGVRLPKEKRLCLRLQWIDYRKRQPEQLKALTNLLHHGSTYVKGYAFSVLPENMEHKVLPEDLSVLSIVLKLLAALSISIGLFLLFSSWLLVLRVCLAIIALVGGTYFFRTADRLEIYTISRSSLRASYILALASIFLFDILAIFVLPGASFSSFLVFLFSNISLYFFSGLAVYILAFFFFSNRKILFSKRSISLVILFFMISATITLCELFSTLYPDLNKYPWLYTIEPSTIIACVFSAFLLSLPFTASFSLKRIYSLLPAQAPRSGDKITEPTLAVPTRLWLSRAVYLLLAFEVALLLLTQSYS